MADPNQDVMDAASQVFVVGNAPVTSVTGEEPSRSALEPYRNELLANQEAKPRRNRNNHSLLSKYEEKLRERMEQICGSPARLTAT